MTIHLELADYLDVSHADDMKGPVERRQDAIVAHLVNGVTLTILYAAPNAYSLHWSREGASARIDTAPVHHDLETFPHHLHLADGRLVSDPVTDPADPPRDNVARLIRMLLDESFPEPRSADTQ